MEYDERLNYPLANQALSSIQQRAQELPYELQQAIMQNPDILKAVQTLISNPEMTAQLTEGGTSESNQQ